VAALTAALGGTAYAACAPNPPTLSTPMTCSGATVGNVTVQTDASITVENGASLTAASGDAAAFTAMGPAWAIQPIYVNLVVNGHVAGGSGAAGVKLTNDVFAPFPFYPSALSLNMTVGATGVIDGSTGILLERNQAGGNTYVTATLNNAGSISSTSGPAIASTDATHESFYSIVNQSTGFIGGIQAAVGYVSNYGTIDGGTNSAYAVVAPYNVTTTPYSVYNSGLMASNSVDATLSLGLAQGSMSVTNDGRIVNSGAGLAIDAVQNLSVSNAAAGTITGGGPIAIRTAGTIALTNRGTITGSVISTAAAGSSTVDTLGGHIDGDVLLGAGDDTLVATYDLTTGKFDEITGRVDGGGGLNTLRMTVNHDAVMDDAASQLPTNFQTFQLSLSQGAAVTFNEDTPDGLSVGGDGALITNGQVTSNGAAFVAGPNFYYGLGLKFTNNGSITSTFNSAAYPDPATAGYAVNLSSLTSFDNLGEITAIGGNGVSINFNYSTPGLLNTGSIVADGTALNVSGGKFVNEGLIRSNTGRAVYVSLGGGTIRTVTSTNNGQIEGVTNGVLVSSVTFANAGTVTATKGVAVNPEWYSAVDNLAGGVITGSTAAISYQGYGYNALISNAGVLNGDVDLRGATIDSSDVFYDKGGTLNGNLLLGAGDDQLVTNLSRIKDGKFTWVTGFVDAGTGNDLLTLGVDEDGAVALDNTTLGFERVAFQLQDDSKLTLTAANAVKATLNVSGKGSVDLNANLDITDVYGLYVDAPYGVVNGPISIISRGALSFKASSQYSGYGALVVLNDAATFENAGVITVASAPNAWSQEVAIQYGKSVVNSGQILLDGAVGVRGATSLTNSGTISQLANGAASTGVNGVTTVVNTGTIQTQNQAIWFNGWAANASLDNSGQIASTGGNAVQADYYAPLTVTNRAGGTISSDTGYAVLTGYYDDKIVNDGAIVGRISLGDGQDLIENRGTITGDIAQGWGDGKIDNYGTIVGDVSLGDGNDTFIQHVGASVTGTVDGGYGLDTLTLDSTNGGSVLASQFTNFEIYNQTGGGSLSYAGAFGNGPIGLDGGSAVVLAGDSATTTGGVTFAGGANAEHVTIEGSISGGVSLSGGVDTVINRGSIGGSVQLGSGDDTYTEGWNSTVVGSINGASGTDTYIFELAGDRNGLHARSGFENLGVTGLGNLTLTLDQNWNAISLAGANVYLTSGAYAVGRLSGGAQDEAVRIDADIAQLDLGGGVDNLQVEFAQVGGAYAGGTGNDTIHFTTTAPVTVAGSLSGFETIALDGGQMVVSGALGATGETTTFRGEAGQTLSILSGGVLSGTVDLGAGDDLFSLSAGGLLAGAVLGGTGNDKVAIDLTSDLSLRGDQLQQFETLQVTGTGALNFTGGAAKFDHLVTNNKDLTLAAGAGLEAGDLTLDGAANTMTVAGAFTGAVDLGAGDDVLRLTTGGTFTGSAQGGAGQDRLELALGGTDAAPIALGATPFNGFEALSVQSGVISVSGGYGFDSIAVNNGRLIGLAGSQLTASTITVAQGATFGSAGSVTGNITVAGTLSPGASPGTMTVTGNVALVAGSTSLFEFTPTVSDQLVVSGTVTIAQGATLKLTGASALTPGRRIDLITAGGGIVGSFSTIDGAQGLNLHIEQSTNRLQALGLFTTDTTFSSQVSTLIGQFNTALVDNTVSASLIAALPALVDPTTSRSDPRALARVTPQAYASATQLALEEGLSIVDASRNQARFAPQTPGLFGFGQGIASRRTLDGDAAVGVAEGKIDTTGGLAGVGYGVESAWAGVFVGYLNGRQRISDLDARTGTDSFVIGAQGQVRIGGFQLGAMAAHDGADADTRRAAPGGTTANGDYKLKSWIADVNLSYRARLNGDWAVQPRLGASYVGATRDGLVERGGGAFALSVQGDKSSAWFVDGQVEVLGGQTAGARLHPYASLGFRSTAGGGDTTASAGLTGFPTPIGAVGLDRSGTLATVGAGAGYDVTPGMTLSATYAGEFGDGGRQALLVGLNWKF
jgi:hypothetical protein